jgi:hypothetical protein
VYGLFRTTVLPAFEGRVSVAGNDKEWNFPSRQDICDLGRKPSRLRHCVGWTHNVTADFGKLINKQHGEQGLVLDY